MKLLPYETDLVGEWIFTDGKMTGNDACARIDYLTKNILREVGRDATGWDIIYQDPDDGRFWEKIYPQSEMQGGGPPRLTCISTEQVRVKYPLNLSNASNVRPEPK